MTEINLLQKIARGIQLLFWLTVIGLILSIGTAVTLTNYQIEKVMALGPHGEAQILANEFNGLLERNELEELKQRCLTEIKKKPLGANGHFYLGLALYHEGNKAESKEHLQKALEIDPTWKPAIQPYLDLL